MVIDIYLIFIYWKIRYPTLIKVWESRSCITLESFLWKWDNTQMLARASSGLCQNNPISKPAFISFYAITHWATKSGQKRGKNSKLEWVYYMYVFLKKILLDALVQISNNIIYWLPYEISTYVIIYLISDTLIAFLCKRQ